MSGIFFAGKVVDNAIYFSCAGTNALCALDLRTRHYSVINHFSCDNLTYYMHKTCLQIDGKLFFIPKESHSLHIYDLLNNSIEELKLGQRMNEPCEGIVFENQIWLFPSTLKDDLLVIDLFTRRIKVEKEFLQFCEKNVKTNSLLKFHRIARVGNIVWLPIFGSNELISYDLLSGEMKKYYLSEVISGAFVGKDKVWLGTIKENIILEWDISAQEISNKYTLSFNDINRTGPSNICEYSGKVIIVPGYGHEIHILDLETKVDKKVFSIEGKALNKNWPYCIKSELRDKDLFIFPSSDSTLMQIKVDTEEVINYPLLCDSCIEEFFTDNVRPPINIESKPFFLLDFINGII